MGVTTKQYMKKPLYVEAVRITRKNFSDVLKWCKGHVQTERTNAPQNAGKKYIKVQAHNPINARQTKAFIGDWVLKTERGYKIYTNQSFVESFDEVVELEMSVLSPKKVTSSSSVPQKADRNVEVEEDFDELDSCAIPRMPVEPGVPQ